MQNSSRWPAPALARRILLGLVVLAAATLSYSPTSAAVVSATSTYGLLTTYPNTTPHVDDEFGSAVAWMPSGSQLVVASRSYQLNGTDPVGAVFILNRDSKLVTQTLHKAVPVANDYFGFSIAVSNTHVLVGAQQDSTFANRSGAAYLFDAGTGSLVQTFTNTAGGPNDFFGSSVAFLTDTVLVGAPQYGPPINVGRAYICNVVDGSCPTAIDSPTHTDGGFFGLALASLGTTYAVGAPLDGNHGTVYVFSAATVPVTVTIVPTSSFLDDNFGHALATVGGDILIGAPDDGTGAINAGAAYLYQPDGTFVRKFVNPDPHVNDLFGSSVAGAGNFVLIGAPQANASAGVGYLFNLTTGALINTFHKKAPQSGDEFGFSVAVQGENFLVGAHLDNTGASHAGAVYRFGVLWNLYLPLIKRH